MSTSTIPTLNLTITGASPSAAARAYGRVDSGADDPGSAPSFGGALERAMQGVIDDGNQADAQSMQAVAGQGNLTEVVTAVSRAELALQTTVAIRDRVVQAYQDIMRMSI
ncbi:MAG TPA: flagellar hook-basal body complex protein FliE [Acetobacteraceae bacterium]|nr:flagellar hook-basal body complex protein FliE [Acetobacteraceae bacterium]